MPVRALFPAPAMSTAVRRSLRKMSPGILLLAALVFASPTGAAAGNPAPEEIAAASRPLPNLLATVTVSGFGEFTIEMNRDEAPNHVAHFLVLAQEGYFDGMAFHRVVPGFVIQTGDPTSRDEDPWNDGMGGPPYRLPFEATTITHLRGTVSMSWRGDVEGTAGSQWFVALDYIPQIDGHATPIGRVVDGMETVDQIAQVTTLVNHTPRHPVRIDHVRLHEAPSSTDTEVETGEPSEGP